MLKQPLFLISFILLLIIGILHNVAIQFFLYWTFPWFDNLMHFLGGLWFGTVSLWYFFFSGFAGRFTLKLSVRNIFVVSIALAIVIGILWEFFEIYVGATTTLEPDYSLDTAADLLMDTLGAIVAAIYAVWRFQSNKQI